MYTPDLNSVDFNHFADWRNTGKSQQTQLDLQAHSATAATAPERSCTQGQVKKYQELCTKKRQLQQDWTGWTYQQMSDEITRLINFYPLSEKQEQLIVEKQENLVKLNPNFKPYNLEQIRALTGGTNGSASSLITTLIEEEKKYQDEMSPSIEKVKMMVGMMYCPDVAWEDYDVRLRVYTGSYVGEKPIWRLVTGNELAKQIMEKMSNRQASEFIDKFRGTFHDWKQTRIRPEQVRYIRQLEARLNRLDKPVVVEHAVVDGEIVEQRTPIVRGERWNPKAYNEMPDIEMAMLSIEDAQQIISQLKKELGDKSLTTYGGDIGEEQQTKVTESVEEQRSINTLDAWKDNERKELESIVYGLMMVMGHTDERFDRTEATNIIVDGYSRQDGNVIVTEGAKEKISAIYDVMMYCVDNDCISIDGLAKMVSKSDIGQMILMNRI